MEQLSSLTSEGHEIAREYITDTRTRYRVVGHEGVFSALHRALDVTSRCRAAGGCALGPVPQRAADEVFARFGS